jgi:hypothetical protein
MTSEAPDDIEGVFEPDSQELIRPPKRVLIAMMVAVALITALAVVTGTANAVVHAVAHVFPTVMPGGCGGG